MSEPVKPPAGDSVDEAHLGINPVSDPDADPVSDVTPSAPRRRSTHLLVLAGNVLVMICGVATGVISARWLGPEQRGEFVASYVWAGFLAVGLALGVPQAIVVDRHPLARIRRALMAHVALMVLLGALCGLILGALSQHWLDWRGIVGVGFMAAGGGATGVAAGLAQRLGRMRGYFQAAMVAPGLLAVVAMVALVALEVTSVNLWLLTVGGAQLCCGVTLLAVGLGGPGAGDGGPWYDRSFLTMTLGALVVTVTSQVVYRLDSLVGALVFESRDFAIYAVAVSALGACGSVAQVAGMVAFSRFRTATRDTMGKEARVACTLAAAGGGVAALFLALLASPLVHLLYGAEFAAAVGPTRLLVFVAIPMGIDYALTQCLLTMNQVATLVRTRVVVGVVGIFAIWAAAQSNLLLVAATMMLAFSVSAASMAVAVRAALVKGWDLVG